VDKLSFPSSSVGTIACLLIALVLRLAVILNQPDQLTLDRDAYLGIATSVAEGRGYSSPNSTSPTAFRPPLYPLCLAAGFRVFPTSAVVAGINLLTGLLTVWLTARLGLILQLGQLRFAAALLVAIDPLLLRYASQPMTESLCTFLATFWLFSVVSSSEPENRRRSISSLISGIAFGFLVLCRPTFWPMAAFCGFAWLFAQHRTIVTSSETPHFSTPARGVFSVIGTVVVVAPWLIRNWIVFGIPILTTTHGGYTLLLGNNPVFYNEVVQQPWGTSWPDASQRAWEDQLSAQMKDDLSPQATEIERDAWQSHRARSFMKANPLVSTEAAIHRIRSLWNTTPQADAADGTSGWVVTTVGWFYFFELVIGLIGMCLVVGRADRGRWWPLYVLILTVQLVHLFYWTNTRMRAPLTPAIALFTIVAITRDRRAPK